MFHIRVEKPQDVDQIYNITKRAFAPMPFADGNDQHLTNRFRDAGELRLSLVAVIGDTVVGHVALTVAQHESGETGWFALGPIAVEPSLQRKGIGSALIAEVKRWLNIANAHGCILVGDTNYYPRHGFELMPDHCPLTEPQEYFMVLKLVQSIPPGRFAFSPLFYETNVLTADSHATSD
jgi:putative acetyltransferase